LSRGFGPDELLSCYARGVFPMADGRDDPRLFLVDPVERGILPLDEFHVPRRLARTVRQGPFDVRFDTAFADVIEGCAAATPSRMETWINAPIASLYGALHRRGAAHSVECWQDGVLVGGLYGVRLGAAFFGESMFSRATDASKVALVHLAGVLAAGGFRLLDTQFITAHLQQFGAREIPRAAYRIALDAALAADAELPLRGPLTSAWIERRLPAERGQAADGSAHSARRLGLASLAALEAAAARRHPPRSE
jgi:leucyl/phenylalanyl-tRNA---protein transferase